MKKLLILGIVAALACAAYAYPTFTGQTGYVNLPSAAVAPAGQFQIAADWYNTDGDATIPVRGIYGIGENFEVGVSYTAHNSDSTASNFAALGNAWSIGGKYRTPLMVAGLDWAVGAQYITADIDPEDLTATQAYFVGSKAFTEAAAEMPGISGSIGVNWTKVDVADEDDSAFRFFLAAEAAFTNNLSVAAEYQTKNDDIDTEALWSVAARYPFTPELTVQAGMTNGILGVAGSDESNFFVGASYTFDTAM